ncbi:CLUMA_CG006524, isoform A [Clunio marinus]|uniref:CLUMA_CG006524, isoform A n=1 Tax=Clunio marinus TaxID=568069 RepID=A0A1J1I2C9_9DIPT|nr:CLUMA_CG006524, isoform A [Clunio marinus]
MTIPTRPAPPPPNRNEANSNNHINASSNSMSARSSAVTKQSLNRKPAPPRPPPPKMMVSDNLKKSGSQKSINIFSNLFGSSKNSSKISEKQTNSSSEAICPPKIPAPPSAITSRHQQKQTTSDVQLINFDESTIESPLSIKKTNTGSDSVSMDSFCSSNSSPNNLCFESGTMSQAESGFEDDFSVSDFKSTSTEISRSTTFSNDPFECIEELPTLSRATNIHQQNIRNLKPTILPKPVVRGSSNLNASTNTIVPSEFNVDESLSNGKSLIKPSSVNAPTIIKPQGKGKTSPTFVEVMKKMAPLKLTHQKSDESNDDDLPSPPMPTIPPPPPPILGDDEDAETCSYAIVLYDYTSDVVEDLNLKTNEKIYLLKKMNEEWLYGRDKRGCEGIFPLSYVDIRVPLKNVETDPGTASRSVSVSPAVESHHIRALYNFNAETDEDLSLRENEIVNVLFEINHDWLYGSNMRGDYGQFPANFIEYVPRNLPHMMK